MLNSLTVYVIGNCLYVLLDRGTINIFCLLATATVYTDVSEICMYCVIVQIFSMCAHMKVTPHTVRMYKCITVVKSLSSPPSHPHSMFAHGRVTPVMRVPMEHLVNKVRQDSRVTLATQDHVVIKEDPYVTSFCHCCHVCTLTNQIYLMFMVFVLL